MNERSKNLVAALVAMFAVCAANSANAQELSTDAEAAALCNYSLPSEGDDSEVAAERETERRKVLHRRFVVNVGPDAAPVLGYDEISGVLAINAYRPLVISDGHALLLDGAGAIPFEVTAERAQDIVARYETEQARLRLEFVPAPFADSEQPICTRVASTDKDTATLAIHGALLKAAIVDQLGRPLATFETSLGREIELMKTHNISGFLASAYPQVMVSSIAFYDGKPSYPKTTPRVPSALDSSLRSQLQKRLYGCYVRGLASNARLQGALVVRVDAVADGAAAIMVDSLNSPAVVGCVVERLGEIGRAHAPQMEDQSSLKVTLIFKLKDNSL